MTQLLSQLLTLVLGRRYATGRRDLTITDWDIWHTYSTHVLFDVSNLQLVAQKLVESGLAEVALVSSGHVWWRTDSGVTGGRVSAELTDDGTRRISFPPDMPPFVLECAIQAATMASHEAHLFHDARGEKYVRAYSSMIELEMSDFSVLLYPQLKLYADGVMLTELRVLSSPIAKSDTEFIDRYVNLFRHPARAGLFPPALLKRYARSRLRSSALRDRLRARQTIGMFDAAVERLTTRVEAGDFSFDLARIDRGLLDVLNVDGEPVPGLRLVAQMFEECAIDLLFGSPRIVGLRQALRHRRDLGTGWVGRPAVYVLDFDGREASASAVIERFGEPLARIMARSTASPRLPNDMLGKNLREFDDYAAFVNPGVLLWLVADIEGVTASYPPDLQRRQFVLEKQVQVEFIEHLDRAYRRLAEQARRPKADVGSLLRHEESILALEESVLRASSYKEIVHLFQAAQHAFGHGAMRDAIRESVRTRAIRLTDSQARRHAYFGWVLTALFGIGAMPSLASSVIQPLFEINQGWWQPASSAGQILFFNGLAAGFLATAIAGIALARRPQRL